MLEHQLLVDRVAQNLLRIVSGQIEQRVAKRIRGELRDLARGHFFRADHLLNEGDPGRLGAVEQLLRLIGGHMPRLHQGACDAGQGVREQCCGHGAR